MEELLMELFNGEWELEVMEDWVPMVEPAPMSWFERFWLTGNTGL